MPVSHAGEHGALCPTSALNRSSCNCCHAGNRARVMRLVWCLPQCQQCFLQCSKHFMSVFSKRDQRIFCLIFIQFTESCQKFANLFISKSGLLNQMNLFPMYGCSQQILGAPKKLQKSIQQLLRQLVNPRDDFRQDGLQWTWTLSPFLSKKQQQALQFCSEISQKTSQMAVFQCYSCLL